jgi:hypothetical protein
MAHNHIVLDGAVVCVDRETQKATILRADLEQIDRLAEIAFSEGAPLVSIALPEPLADILVEDGWRRTPLVVIYKESPK